MTNHRRRDIEFYWREYYGKRYIEYLCEGLRNLHKHASEVLKLSKKERQRRVPRLHADINYLWETFYLYQDRLSLFPPPPPEQVRPLVERLRSLLVQLEGEVSGLGQGKGAEVCKRLEALLPVMAKTVIELSAKLPPTWQHHVGSLMALLRRAVDAALAAARGEGEVARAERLIGEAKERLSLLSKLVESGGGHGEGD
jgi:hypothetical protein